MCSLWWLAFLVQRRGGPPPARVGASAPPAGKPSADAAKPSKAAADAPSSEPLPGGGAVPGARRRRGLYFGRRSASAAPTAAKPGREGGGPPPRSQLTMVEPFVPPTEEPEATGSSERLLQIMEEDLPADRADREAELLRRVQQLVSSKRIQSGTLSRASNMRPVHVRTTCVHPHVYGMCIAWVCTGTLSRMAPPSPTTGPNSPAGRPALLPPAGRHRVAPTFTSAVP